MSYSSTYLLSWIQVVTFFLARQFWAFSQTREVKWKLKNRKQEENIINKRYIFLILVADLFTCAKVECKTYKTLYVLYGNFCRVTLTALAMLCSCLLMLSVLSLFGLNWVHIFWLCVDIISLCVATAPLWYLSELVKLETPLGRAPDENPLMALQSGLRSGERPGSATAHKAIKPDVAASHRASAAEEE